MHPVAGARGRRYVGLSTLTTVTIDLECRAQDDFRGTDRVATSQLRIAPPNNRTALFTDKN